MVLCHGTNRSIYQRRIEQKRKPDACPGKLRLSNWKGLFDVLLTKAIV